MEDVSSSTFDYVGQDKADVPMYEILKPLIINVWMQVEQFFSYLATGN